MKFGLIRFEFHRNILIEIEQKVGSNLFSLKFFGRHEKTQYEMLIWKHISLSKPESVK